MKRSLVWLYLLIFPVIAGCSCNNDMAFEHCRVVLADRVVEDGAVYIKDGKIAYAGSVYGAPSSDGFLTINARGLTALPALINVHVHDIFYKEALKNFQSDGFGSLCDLSPRKKRTEGELKNFAQVRDSLNSEHSGSRIFASNPVITARGGFGAVYVDTPIGAALKVREYVKQGADLISINILDFYAGKRYKALTPQMVGAITDEAHRSGKMVAALVFEKPFLDIALDNGVDILSIMPICRIDEATMLKIREKNIIVISGMEYWMRISQVGDAAWLDYAVRSMSYFHMYGVPFALGSTYAEHAQWMKWDEGYPAVEIELMRKSGLTNLEIIKAATENAAPVTGNSTIGSLESGKVADVLFVEGKPDMDIDDLRNIRYMTQNGKLVIVR